MTPLRGARSVVYSSATRAASRSAFAVPTRAAPCRLRPAGCRAPPATRRRCAVAPGCARGAAFASVGLGLRELEIGRGAFDRRAVLPGIELHQRIAGLHPVALLHQIAVDASRHPYADRDVAVGADHVAGPREDRNLRRARSGGVTTTGVVSTVGTPAGGDPATHDTADGDEHEERQHPSQPAPLPRGRSAARGAGRRAPCADRRERLPSGVPEGVDDAEVRRPPRRSEAAEESDGGGEREAHERTAERGFAGGPSPR